MASRHMPHRFQVAVTRERGGFVAQCIEVDVASQGTTLEDALGNLREALELYFQDASGAQNLPSPAVIRDLYIDLEGDSQ